MGDKDATKFLLAAGREVLTPIGVTPSGRGRNWLDDHGWWIVNVEFQPSGWTKGSYLNVGVQWLWKPHPGHSFEYGARVPILTNGKPVQFVELENETQFAKVARELVASAAREVFRYRETFRTLGACIKALRKYESLYPYHLAVAYGLVGKDHESRRFFDAGQVKKTPRDWEVEQNALMDELSSLVRDTRAFRARILEIVNQQRHDLKLDPDRVIVLRDTL